MLQKIRLTCISCYFFDRMYTQTSLTRRRSCVQLETLSLAVLVCFSGNSVCRHEIYPGAAHLDLMAMPLSSPPSTKTETSFHYSNTNTLLEIAPSSVMRPRTDEITETDTGCSKQCFFNAQVEYAKLLAALPPERWD